MRLVKHFEPLWLIKGEKQTVEQAAADWDLPKREHSSKLFNARKTSDVLHMITHETGLYGAGALQDLALFGLLIPPNTAWVERGFSIMKKIKTADRNRLRCCQC